MAKRSLKEVRPLYLTFHEYNDALSAYIDAVTMMHNAVRTVIQVGQLPESVRQILQERLDELDAATYGKQP